MCWQKIRREKTRKHLYSRRKKKEVDVKKPEDELRLEYRRVIIKYALEMLASHSGKIIPPMVAILIYVADWLGEKDRR